MVNQFSHSPQGDTVTATQPATATDLFTVETIPAGELAPGDVVLDEDGHRRFAAFDVDFDADRSRYVTVWTAVADQEAGVKPRLHLVPIAPVTVRRRVGGPRVTRTTLAPECPACRYFTGHTSWCPNR